MANAALRSAKRVPRITPFWAALRVVSIPLLVMILLPYIFISLVASNAFFLLLFNLILGLVLLMIWFHMSREFLQNQGWKYPSKTLLFSFFAGFIPFLFLTDKYPLTALLVFVVAMQTLLLTRQPK
ncbi:MAG: hypothetical protein ACREHC_00200 [Candidatus Levyibacteriota bacterium]